MKYTIELNDELVAKAQQLTGIKTKKAIVNKALQAMIDLYESNRKKC
jgi:Arc/MetJ family transcription regulator